MHFLICFLRSGSDKKYMAVAVPIEPVVTPIINIFVTKNFTGKINISSGSLSILQELAAHYDVTTNKLSRHGKISKVIIKIYHRS